MAVYVGYGGVGDLGDDFFGGGIVDGDPVGGGVFDEFAVDEDFFAEGGGVGAGHGDQLLMVEIILVRRLSLIGGARAQG